ncbi:carcinine hydrolase/isopenicillin-N N-acyltransferase family protein [Flavivirga amylovorans]|uniref:Carcinine hydrolase/isopenicillin-N N-acyltransferase family protein n=1 Tax=Flavivirga amylovorans TaxID=870486 RepID=A0ABT8WYE2_9FLAO|nr:carcinine hydrolase/isopenicillin-N N-acyltransferase family protein [Flavivirga amylovorans]MDO5986702.1 carcinine hydrolase/isopenicillin-N N-acyltransferase family protein [Flavivirga amylovorans]
MKKIKLLLVAFFGFLMTPMESTACSVLYYVDSKTGKIYVVNSEDYWLDVDAYIQIEPRSKNEFARLWYGWDNFAQGGINDKGLFFDAAVTPEKKKIKGYRNPKNNLGDKILAHCSTVEEALVFLEKEKIALNKSHMMFGDKTGKAVVVEWINGERMLHWIEDNKLIMTNYLLSEPEAGNYPCNRYESIENRILELENNEAEINLLKVGNTFGQAGQPARELENGRVGGTVYTSFIDITDNKFFLSYKLSNKNVIQLDLNTEFEKSKQQKIKLKE